MSEEKRKYKTADLAICDEQEEYAEQLLRVLEEHLGEGCRFHLFHDVGKMEEYADRRGLDVLIIGEEYEKEIRNDLKEKKRLVLTGRRDESCSGETAEAGRDGYESDGRIRKMIFRYQPAVDIAASIRRVIIPGKPAPAKRSAEVHPAKIIRRPAIRDSPVTKGLIGVYSPIHRIGKTKFALRIGQKMAEKGSVLYLNLEGYSGYEYYFPEGARKDLGDILYCMKQERSDYGLKISSMAGQIGKMDFIAPMENEQDLRSVSREEWTALFDMILEECIYDTVILDLGDCVDGLYEILRKCVKVYTPYIRDGISEAKLAQYEDNLRQTGYEDILAHTVKRVMKSARLTERQGKGG